MAAKERKQLPTMADVDPTEKDQVGSVFVPNPNVKKNSLPRRRVIPARTEYRGKDIIQHPAQFAGSLEPAKNTLLNRREMPRCEGAEGCPRPTTSYVRLPGAPRESTYPACAVHTANVKKWHNDRGVPGLEVKDATSKSTYGYGVMKAKMKEEGLLYGAAALHSAGLPLEEVLNFGIEGAPGRPKHNREPQGISMGSAPQMSEEEAEAYKKKRNKDRKEKPTVYNFNLNRGTEVKMGNRPPAVSQNAPLGKGTGEIDRIFNMKKAGDPKWESEAKRLNIHPTLLEPTPRYSGKATGVRKEGIIPVAPHRLVRSEERTTKAVDKLTSEHIDETLEAFKDKKQAEKQRAIESRKKGLAIGVSEARAIEPPK